MRILDLEYPRLGLIRVDALDQALVVRRGRLDVPVIAVAKSGWVRKQLVARAQASVTEYGGFDRLAFGRLVELLQSGQPL